MAVVYTPGSKIIRLGATGDEVTTPLQVKGILASGGAQTLLEGDGGAALFSLTSGQYMYFGERGHYFANGIEQDSGTGTTVIFLA